MRSEHLALIAKVEAFGLKSFTYIYKSDYGCPETDTKAEKVASVKLNADKKTVSLVVPDRKPGRVYDFALHGVKSAEAENLLHTDAYYTVNEIPK